MDTASGKPTAKPGASPVKPSGNLPRTTPEAAAAPIQEATEQLNETQPTNQANQKTATSAPRRSSARPEPTGAPAARSVNERAAAAAQPAPPGTSVSQVQSGTDGQTPGALAATEAFSEKSVAASAKPAATQSAATRPMEATADFHRADSDEAQRPEAPPAKRVAKPAEKSSAEKPGTILGDFRLEKKLGEGGMGAVYKAQQISMDRTVALKLLSKNLAGNKAFVDRFYREARTMARLDHPNIVRGYAVGQIEGLGQHFVSMEFIDGLSMQKWMNKLGKLCVGDAVHVLLCAAYALEHGHEQGLVHRDIKPDNLLMTNKGVLKVADLGLAKMTDDNMTLTQSGTGFGTPFYMPLEQYRDAKHVDRRADIYALGITLYYFLTGKFPFFAETHFDVIKLKEAAKFTPARKHNPEIPERLDLMIDKMIQKSAAHRYQTCAEVIVALESLGVANEFPSFIAAASPPGAAKRTRAPAMRTLPATSTPTAVAATSDDPARELWVLRYKDERGHKVKKHVSIGRLKQLIEQGEIDPAASTVHRVNDPTQRPLSSVPELASLVQSKMVHARADRRSQKLEDAYERIERQARRLRILRAIGRFLRGVGGLIMIAAIIAALAFGGWWLFKNKDTVVRKVQDAAKSVQDAGGAADQKEPHAQ